MYLIFLLIADIVILVNYIKKTIHCRLFLISINRRTSTISIETFYYFNILTKLLIFLYSYTWSIVAHMLGALSGPHARGPQWPTCWGPSVVHMLGTLSGPHTNVHNFRNKHKKLDEKIN